MRRSPEREAIAIIGVGVRLPGADSLEQFWGHLAAGRSLISEVPARRWDSRALEAELARGGPGGRIRGGFLADADAFDAAFFNISPREAAWMDPQQRFALELAWQAIEDAACPASALAGSNTGVFMGVCHWDYAELLEKHLTRLDAYAPTGIAFSIIANRVSHFFDLRGPSVTNDTACAASLTSIHEAVTALQEGRCTQALAGGVNLIWSPNHFVTFSRNGMLSREGASRAFDARADGYVRGEGGAMLLLKPLDQALADGDPIRGVIRASGVNHGGRTNSLTVTNPRAQAELIASTLKDAGLGPESIDYIEAHGTGTPLGDPIEISGLKEAFARLHQEAGSQPRPGSCGIGSVKTNIGHLEGAAGVAGVVKVLAALGHECLPANVDFAALNPLIDLEGSPFRIQQQASPWPRQPGRPRRAGVSAFGFGGSNAHLVLEEAPLREAGADLATGPWLLPLSARDAGRLPALAAQLRDWLAQADAGLSLADLAWTLQAGREALAARVLWQVDSLPALSAALDDFLVRGMDSPLLFTPGAGTDPAARLAARWLAGEGLTATDWQSLSEGVPARRLHLPTYPFARERHWMDASLGPRDDGAAPHPLLHRNQSRLGLQCYRSSFMGNEFFWAEHHVGERQLLPGVVCLEMARAAWSLAAGRAQEPACSLEQVVWRRPIQAGEAPTRLEIRLSPREGEKLGFEIATQEDPDALLVQGQVGPLAAGEEAFLDLAHWRAGTQTLEPAALYARLAATGMHHGPSFQAVTALYRGEGHLLARLKLSRRLGPTLGAYALHPILLDAAIQPWIGLEPEGPLSGAAVPFSCRQVEVLGPCTDTLWALLQPLDGGQEGLRRLRITLADGEGRVRLRFQDLALRLVAPEAGQEALLFSAPTWEAAPLPPPDPAREGPRTRVLHGGFAAASVAAWQQQLQEAGRPDLQLEALPAVPAGQDPAQAWCEALCQRLLATRAEPGRQQWLILLPRGWQPRAAAALGALLRSLAAEQPRWSGAVLTLDPGLTPGQVGSLLAAEALREDGYSEIDYDPEGQRRVCRPRLLELPPATPYAGAGVVWVTGGAGGLGQHFAAWLAERGAAHVVLSSRSGAPRDWTAGPGGRCQVHERPCDVTDAAQVRQVADWISRELGPLRGVIHGAGILRDGYLQQKAPGDLAAVFAPKVLGLQHLEQVTRDQPLDFFVLCSSIAATLGNPGQSDYAAANAWMEAWAREGAGRIAIAWPLWEAGGMQVEGATRAALQRRFGSAPLPTARALEALERILAARGPAAVTVHYGRPERLEQVLAGYGAAPAPLRAAAAPAPGAQRSAPVPDSPEALEARTIAWLRDLLGELIQMAPEKIHPRRRLEEYGLDSIVIVEMTGRMEEALGPLSKTLFFEYVDLAGVAGHLVAEQGPALAALFAGGEAEAPAPAASPEPEPETDAGPRVETPGDAHDIAIVGLSLHVAGADDQDSFWDMLAQGRHQFRPLPESRWAHDSLVHPERDVLGKTVVRSGAFLDHLDRFDPRYFRISQAEAELMSPEVRLFLQSAVEAFEDAGYSRETLQRRYGGQVAVIVGTMTNDYNLYGFQNMLQRGALASGSYTGTVPNMVSYYYGFTGPSYFLDTMCSAAATCVLEAVHMLRAGRVPMVLAGGISLLLHPQKLIATSQEHFTSKTAEVIRGYGLGADGTILGEGVGSLVLKRLEDARRDGDHIYGVIKGGGISNAGIRNGFTVPNPHQQAAAIGAALADAGVDPASIGYIEGHGSGTALGDPIEIRALNEVYGKAMGQALTCPIGTVKSNVAHLLGAAALPGIVKVLLQMQRGQLVPSLHADTLNPNIPFADTPFRVQRQLEPWRRRQDGAGRELPLRAGVTSIGAGGINVHLILEEAPPRRPPAAPGGPVLLPFSAMNPERLRLVLERCCAWLEQQPQVELADLAWTLQVGRNELPCRLALVAADAASARRNLLAFLAGEAVAGLEYVPSILERDLQPAPGAVDQALAAGRWAELGAWWCAGVAVPWEQQPGAAARQRLSLPSYPFESVRCWYQEYPDAPSVLHPLGAGLKLHPFVGQNHSDRHGLCYRTSIYLNELLDYVYSQSRQPRLLPTAVLEMLLGVARAAGFPAGSGLADLEAGLLGLEWQPGRLLEARVLEAAGQPLVQLTALAADGPAQVFARARLLAPAGRHGQQDLAALQASALEQLDRAAFYRALGTRQLGFGPYQEVLQGLWRLPQGGMLGALRREPPRQDHFPRQLSLPPQVLGGIWQALCLAQTGPLLEPGRLAALELTGADALSAAWVLLQPEAAGDWQVLVLDEAGQELASLRGLGLEAPRRLEADPGLTPVPVPAAVVGQGAGQGAGLETGQGSAPARAAALSPDRRQLELPGAAGMPANAAVGPAPNLTSNPAAQAPATAAVAAVAPAPAPGAALLPGLRELVAGLLKFDPAQIEPRASFHDLGFDSISLTRLTGEINAGYGTDLSPAIFYECEHLAALADWLAARGARAVADPAAGDAAAGPAAGATQPLPAAPALAVSGAPAAGRQVAIVAYAARLPGSPDAASFFQHLLEGRDLVGPLPLARYPAAYRARMEAAGFPLLGGFLADIDRFDAAAFKTSPHEAQRLDPQQRLLLETAWRAMEHGGYRPGDLPADCGVFVGISGRDYASLLQDLGVPADAHVATGNSLAMAANRLSWQFNLHGPSEAVDTACSSSLVALLRAVDCIRSGRSEMALAAGVNLALALEGFAGPWQAGMLSPGGRCRSFSSAADGYVRGEGVVVLLLKELAAAERDGDAIWGLVAGGAENHGGHAGALTAPSARAQAELVQRAMAGIDPASIGYIEAHGTGTPLGDPVEVNGLKLAYGALAGSGAPARIGLGSVKSSIGHLEAAAGLAGVLKVLLALEAGELPPTLHCARINPYIDLSGTPFHLVRERQPWPRGRDADGRELPRRAGVSSFGFGGSNAHLVLEEYRGEGRRRRQPLPPRVFADSRYWLPGPEAAAGESGADGVLLFAPRWTAAALEPGAGPAFQAHQVLAWGLALAPGENAPQVLPPAVLAGSPAACYSALAARLLEALQQFLGREPRGNLLFQLALPATREGRLYAGLGALLDSAMAEHPRLSCQLLELPAGWPEAKLLDCLRAEARGGRHRRVRYEGPDGAGRQVRGWEELARPAAPASRWRADGVYLISGGLGALGRQVAAHVARLAPGATLVLAGASPLDPERQQALTRLQQQGVRASYLAVDMADPADPAAVAALVQHCRSVHGGLHGVIHCAGIHRDRGLLRKTPEEFLAVLAPKVQGAEALLQACQGLALEVFLLFSSLAGAVGNAGQVDYAAANGFLDALAEQQGAPLVALDWPLWREGGMQVDAAGEAAFFARMGQRPLETGAGLEALEAGLASGRAQVAVLGGELEAMRAFFRGAPMLPGREAAQAEALPAASATALVRAVEGRLGALLGELTGLPAAAIQPGEPLEQYGIDSLMIKRLNQALGSHFQQLSQTLFFEHRSLAQVAAHLAAAQPEACRAWTGTVTETAAAAGPDRISAALPAPSPIPVPQAGEPIAIIGISGRYPGAGNLEAFWANLAAGRECIGDIPPERWSLADFFEPDPDLAVARGLSYCRRGGFLEGFADFDPLFFRISPREAAAMDPQERLFLMQAWAACEDAAYSRERLESQHGSRVGVFVGVTKQGYGLHPAWVEEGGARIRPGTSFASVANRVSFHLGLKGPSLPVDTMCSSSLTAIHEACAHLRRGECELALAGGVNLYLHPQQYVELCAARMLSPDGHCRSFGAGGNGFVPGEGVGCLVLKPLSRALADGDRIHALIRGSAINHGGKTAGYTVPSPGAQGQVVREALAQAGVAPEQISYLEAHGTGTELGDPIEFTGLCQAFGPLPAGSCALGSVKSGIGHLEAAAGIAGVTKVLLQMRHGQLAPSLHGETLNPLIPWAAAPFRLQTRLEPWPRSGRPWLAGVSSFGAGGANAHLVLEAWPQAEAPATAAGPEAILLSARDERGLRAAAGQLLAFLASASVGAADSGTAGLLPELTRLAGELCSVAPEELEPGEELDSYGFDPVQRQALRRALEQRYGLTLDPAAAACWRDLAAVAGSLAAALPPGGAAAPAAGPVDLTDLAWTLQLGREAMEQRLAILADSPADLAARLEAWLAGREQPERVWRGSVGEGRRTLGLLAQEPDIQALTGRWLEAGELPRVLGLWVQGLPVDWRRLPRSRPGRPCSAPTYPFARETYWLPDPAGSGPLARVLQDEPEGRETLLAAQQELEQQLARLVPTLLQGLELSSAAPWPAWRTALERLLAAHPRAMSGEAAAARAAWQAYRARPGPAQAQTALVDGVLAALPEILAGRLPATAVMFPGGRLEQVEAVYKQNPVAARFSLQLARAAAAWVGARQGQGGLRILEVGAGTGGTTVQVLEALAPLAGSIAEYCYTDLSRAFLIHGERQFQAGAPYLRTALFDLEQDPERQGLATGAYDLVIAANVLHATRSMADTLARVGSLLAPGGLLLVNETSCATLFTHLTFGLLEGWWRFTDPECRIPGAPALETGSWHRLVEAAGLEWVAASPAAEQALGQQLWAARRPGRPASRSASQPVVQAAASSAAPSVLQPAPAPVAGPAQPAAGAGAATRTLQAPAGDLRRLLLETLAATLNLAPAAIDPRLSFADYGLDSILGAELVHRLRQRLGVSLQQTELFDYPNLEQLAALLEQRGAQPPVGAGEAQAPVVTGSSEPAPLQVPASVGGAVVSIGAAAGPREPIAIVGYSGRFAGSEGPEALWQHLRAGRDLVQPVSRFDLAPHYRGQAPGSWCGHGSFIDGVDRFDARFFNISGLEATYMDPQQRLFLEEAWRTLEHAGHAGADMAGRACGVFVGCAHGDYQELFQEQPPGQAFWGNTCSLIPARIAYYLNLKGPAVAVDTACSSSLVAVHLACHSLWQGESELALAGGVFIQSSPRFYLYANQARMLSPSGRCAAFGAGADGIVPGEAVAAVLLRPLSQALADGDTIHGLIVATGINQDGATNGITAPSAQSQEQLLGQVYRQYGIDPGRIELLEAHGTGTPLGDPIEHEALSRAFRGWSEARGYCALGSVKSNLGHATTAAGITGLVKVLLALGHEEIPPTLHASPPNPALDLEHSPFYLNGQLRPWPRRPGAPRLAGVSSFGFGGTNAHLVLQEAPSSPVREVQRPVWLFVLSAISAEALAGQADDLAAWLQERPVAPASLASTLALGRRHGEQRLAVLAAGAKELAEALLAWRQGQAPAGVHEGVRGASPAPAARPDLPELRRLIEAEPERYRAALETLAQAFLAGDDEAPGLALADLAPSRISLPGTRFMGKSYWVGQGRGGLAGRGGSAAGGSARGVEFAGEAAGEDGAAPGAAAASRAAAVSGPSRRELALEPIPEAAPGLAPAAPRQAAPAFPIRLAPVRAWDEAGPAPSVWRPVSLAPLGGAAAAPGGTLQRLEDEAGVRRLLLDGVLDQPLLAALAQALQQAAAAPDVHVLLLQGNWQGDERDAGAALLLDCPLPVIAAPTGAQGLALAAGADFLVLARAGSYRRPAAADPLTLVLLARRFGPLPGGAAGGENIDAGTLARGALVVEPGLQASQALALARQVAAAPRGALLALKAHMRRGPQVPEGLPGPALGAAELAAGPAGPEESTAWGQGQPIALDSPVMRLELYPDGVALLQMQEREQRNCFTPAFMAGLEEVFARLQRLPGCKVLVLTGHGAYFACGGTREGLESLQRGDSHFTDQRIYSLPLEFPLPVIAAMQGHAIGAGWSLGLFCDQALYAADSVYHSNYLQFGFTPGAGATLVFPRRLGDDLGREVLFSAREWKGRELAGRCPDLSARPREQVLPLALALAHRLARQSRADLEAAKAAAAAPLRQRLEAVLAQELAMHDTTFIGNPLVLERIQQHFAGLPPAPAPAPAPSLGREAVHRALRETLAEELLLDPAEISESSSFLALGLDSILAVTWIRKLNARLGLDLPATCVYAHPSVGALLTELLGRLPSPPPASAPVPPPPAPEPVPQVTPEPAQERGAARQALRQVLRQTLAEELLLDPAEIGEGSSFLALGLDSILAVTWIRKLNARLGLDLPATCVYAHPSVGALLAELQERLPAGPAAAAPARAAEQAAERTTERTTERAGEADAGPVVVQAEAGLPVAPPPASPAPTVNTLTRLPSAADGAETADGDAIAIIGAAGRFPQAGDLAAFWDNIRQGRDCIEEVPPSRWRLEEFYDPDPQAPGKSYSKWMGALTDVDRFDAAFFNITAREAELMDPQQRLFLEQAWLALEDGAIDPSRLAGCRCGIFVGSGDSGYGDLIPETNAYSLSGSASSILAARLAYLLDLRGPAIALDTACSTSLVAIASACDSLRLGNTDLALAGGASLMLGPRMHVDTCKVGMLSPDGRCHSFDQGANGFVPGEGVGVVLLKRLADARRDGDPIRAVIRGWGTNQDGRTNGITAPNPLAQGELLRSVYRRFGIAPESIGLVEAHGTGTPLGDPIEIEGLQAGFGPLAAGTRVALGSVKSNVGHLLAAAGVAGALKAMLALEHAELPPSIHFHQENEHLHLDKTPFRVQTRLEPWPESPGTPRRAAVSAFGFSGTNAHLVLEAWPRPAASAPAAGDVPLLLPLSARSSAQLAALAGQLARHLRAHPELDLADCCWTLQQGRQAFECRAAWVVSSREAMLECLDALAAGRADARILSNAGPRAPGLFDPEDGDARELLDKWLAGGRLEPLARLWVQGLALDWSRLPGSAARRRLRLPGYPFARDRHWLSAAPARQPAAGSAGFRLQGPAGGPWTGLLRGDEAGLGLTLVEGLARVGGAAWLEPVRAALAAAGVPAARLEQLVWGRPLVPGASPLALRLHYQAASGLFRLESEAGEICLAGRCVGAAGPWPEAPAGDGLQEATLEFRRARPWARGLSAVWRGAAEPQVWRGRWSRPPGENAPGLLLEAVWQLVAWGEEQRGLPGPRFPLALSSLQFADAGPEAGWIWLWSREGDLPGMSVLVQDLEGRPCLALSGWLGERLEALAELRSEREEQQP
ncbi:SDR family NAD(P)-dependent oxidoreductase [Azovibrio restrictus]|uniref:SDR family NAD(P)-dependent oxidoreductase n=1 Tax=Azovibrio restrictus TaxID=146938 RepID=UPI000415DAB8|nr:SDR family NAD(P)-dependent oxidoreductase [Azovibrio restrictus]